MLRNIFLFSLLSLLPPKECSSVSIHVQWPNSTDMWNLYFELSTLQYGENCSWEGEKLRRDFLKLGLSESEPDVSLQLNEILVTGLKMCSEENLLICDQKSQKCKCGSFTHEFFNGPNSGNVILEGDNDTMTCKLNFNVQCGPSAWVTSSCRLGSTCNTTSGKICSLENYEKQEESVIGQRAKFNACTCISPEHPPKSNGNLLRWSVSPVQGIFYLLFLPVLFF